MEVVRALPSDLGPEAVGLSTELIKQRLAEESIDVRYYMLSFILFSNTKFFFLQM